jgi:hypothetical protein
MGYEINRIDHLVESIPRDYPRSPFLPVIMRGMIHKICYYVDVFEQTRDLDGDIVECGVSIGQGALLFLLISSYVNRNRTYYGFDSFEGFPWPADKDEETPIKEEGFYGNPPETVLKTLRDGRIPDETIKKRVHLVKGWFEDTLSSYKGSIAVLHLDCDLYDSYMTCLESLYDKLTPGGIIMFDEYNDNRWPGASKAIDEFFTDKPEVIQPHSKCPWKFYVVKE